VSAISRARRDSTARCSVFSASSSSTITPTWLAGWSNGKTLFWIAAADAQGRKRKYRKGDVGFHHYAFELSSRDDVDELGAFLEQHGMTVLDPPGEYYGRNYYAVYFADPDGMKLEGMIWAPPKKPEKAKRKPAARKKTQARKS
jgi:catechol-2,3-dioxygenase